MFQQSEKRDSKPQNMDDFIAEAVKSHNEKRRRHGARYFTV